ncbi:unnamed protein product, partial [marine sediment metagenome]
THFQRAVRQHKSPSAQCCTTFKKIATIHIYFHNGFGIY